MKKLIWLVFGIVLLIYGCTITAENGEGDSIIMEEDLSGAIEGVNLEDYVEITLEEGAQVIEISAFQDGEGWDFPEEYEQNIDWYFPLEIYEDEFVSIGQYQDYFIKLDNTHMPSLAEGEALWLYPMVVEDDAGENTGILFKAFHSNEVECDGGIIKILGKTYSIENLKDGSSFLGDDKWKIAHEYEGDCLNRVVIYLDGYFYDLENEEKIDLFFNDETLTLEFQDLESKPKLVIKLTE